MMLHARSLYDDMMVKEQQYDCCSQAEESSEKNFTGNYTLSIHED
jgi:hypothetical protein